MCDICCTLLHFPGGTTAPEAPEAAELFCGNLVVVVRRVTEWMAVQTARLSRIDGERPLQPIQLHLGISTGPG